MSWVAGSSPLTRGKRGDEGEEPGGEGLIPAHAGKTQASARVALTVRAHPRSRGENTLIRADDKTFKGSSPLTRGKRRPGARPPSPVGLIPAHAGKTPTWCTPTVACWAHPRSRGENANFLGAVVSSPGSSPLTRGKQVHAVRRWFRGGLIPAHAGKTCSSLIFFSFYGAHPRSRGENVSMAPLGAQGWGSSPLTRGKRK